MSLMRDLIEQNAHDPSPLVRFLNYLAAVLGIGTFLQVVNVVVGVLSATWLMVQLWGWFKYERPRKLIELERGMIDLEERRAAMARVRAERGGQDD